MSELSPFPESSYDTALADRRRSPRQERQCGAWLSTAVSAMPNSKAAGLNVTVSDLSLHGVGFTSDKELKTGDAHWMVIADGQLRLSTRLRVVTVRARDGKWVIGAEFF